jgi:3-methyladenine DNA glycosylase/8-oxoguanine DNA glycosylase
VRVEVRVEVEPRWPVRLPGFGSRDGIVRCRGGVLERLLHLGEEPAVVRAAQLRDGRVVIGARAGRRDVAGEAVERMRFALGVDDDLRPFYDRFRDDPLIGRSVRARPWLRVPRRPVPFEALAWAISEQLIEAERAEAIQRRIVARWGRRAPGWDGTPLRDIPSAATLAAVAPAELQALDLSAGRALAMVRVAREVAAGRADLHAPDHERGWRRLRAIPGIGAWTVEVLALHGQGRYDQLPAGDLAFLKLVGRLATGDPRARAQEQEVREFFAPYHGWAGLAATHLLSSPLRGAPLAGPPTRPARATAPRPEGTRSSASAGSRGARSAAR